MANIKDASARIVTTRQGALPACKILPGTAVANLTQGFAVDSDPTLINPAINFKGTVAANFASPAELAKWKFGFIQLHRINRLSFYYAGPTRSEGSVTIDVAAAPAMGRSLCLDSDTAFDPWTSNADHDVAGGLVTNFSHDHPCSRASFERGNRNTGRMNYLFQLVDDRDLWTIFTARDPDGAWHHLAHVHWSLLYDFMFEYRGGKPRVARNACSFPTPDPFVLGAPKDPQLAALLAKPAPPYANDVTRTAMTIALGAYRPNRIELDDRYLNVPGTFWLRG